MTDHEDFFAKGQQIPAVFKHTLLVNYLQPFVAMTAKRSKDRRVWYLDGYAGHGTYQSDGAGGAKAAGSPLLALRAAQKARAFPDPVDMRCVFVEADPTYAALLRQLEPPRVQWRLGSLVSGLVNVVI